MSVKELLDMTTTFIREKVYWRVVVKDKNIVGSENNIWGFGIYDSPNPDVNDNRYCLELNHCGIDNDKTLITLLMNPSETFPCENDNSNIDDTILNVMKIAKALGIMSVIVLNTIPIINSKKELALKGLNKQKQRHNEMFVNGFLKHCDKENTIFLAAWGSDKNINSFNKYSQTINTYFKDKIYAFSINKDMTPTHPSGFNNAQINAFIEKPELIPIKQINDDLTVIV